MNEVSRFLYINSIFRLEHIWIIGTYLTLYVKKGDECGVNGFYH